MEREPLLSPSQSRALRFVRERSSGAPVDATLRVTLNFHPDRLHDGRLLLDAIALSGVYRSQFETRTSNGGLTAHPGGDRWEWESRIFGGAYDGAPASDRPKYGALNFRNRPTGGSPRFGSSHLRLNRAAVIRSTFCYPDSAINPVHFGVADRMGLIDVVTSAPATDLLDDYIEAHVHGPVTLADVEALVLDPSYRDGPIEKAAARLGVPIEWHRGFSLSVDQLVTHPDYRGQRYVDLGCALAEDGVLTPRIIGSAAQSGNYDEQDLKRVWHYVARFGGEPLQ